MRVLAFLCLAALCARAQDPSLHARMRAAKGKVFPTLVHITNVEEVFTRGRREKSVSTGSGFFIDAQGHIVSNYHVAGKTARLFVILPDRRRVEAKLIAGDPYTDVAVLRVEPKLAWPDGKPVFASFGDSNRLEEGSFVMAMGSPLSLSRSVSFGIISCRDRSLGTMRLDGFETGKYNTWLQTDAAINPGNSGGPLVNLDGEVVGVNTRASFVANNIGFAIPSVVVRHVVAALLEHKTVPRSWLGLRLQGLEAIENSLLKTVEDGVLVAAVAAGSPAERAGMRPGDFITKLDGKCFAARFDEQLPALYWRIAQLKANATATLTIVRGGDTTEMQMRPAPLERDIGAEKQVKAWGITVRAITARMMRDLGLPDVAGVLVTGIRAGAPAGGGRLENGDVIRKVQGKDIVGLESFLELTKASIQRKDVLVRIVVRRGTIVDVTALRPRYE